MNEEQFKAQFIASFCAAWCANNYNDACMRGEQERLENPPMEDAKCLADSTWIKFLELGR